MSEQPGTGPGPAARSAVTSAEALPGSPVVPLLLVGFGGYLLWFAVKYWRGTGPAVWPSYPVKSVLQGKGLPGPQPATSADVQVTAYETSLSTGQQPRGGGAGTGVGGYVNPFRGATITPNRIDQGVDFTGTGPIAAIGRGTVLVAQATGSGWPSASDSLGFVSYRLEEGPAKGKIVFIAEGIIPTVKPGQQVQAGQQVATFTPGGSIETGWASGEGTTSESNTPAGGGISGAGPFPTRLGQNFDSLLAALGVPGSPDRTGKGFGNLPPGYPSSYSAQPAGAKGQPQNTARLLLGQYGWQAGQFSALQSLWTRESGWSPGARNPTSGALGIAQALGHGTSETGGTLGNEYGPQYGLTVDQARAANSGSIVQQIRWGLGYIKARYGSPQGALAHENAVGWY